MPVEFLGMIRVKPSESNAAMHIVSGGINHDYLCRSTKAHDDPDFDGVLIGYASASADGLHVGEAATVTMVIANTRFCRSSSRRLSVMSNLPPSALGPLIIRGLSVRR